MHLCTRLMKNKALETARMCMASLNKASLNKKRPAKRGAFKNGSLNVAGY